MPFATRPPRFVHRPRALFEEWYDPLISGIRWVEELIETAGGEFLLPKEKPDAALGLPPPANRSSTPLSSSDL